MNCTPRRARACPPPTFVVGREETLVGHCVNVRDLGKLAFFSLCSQTRCLQVVCTSKIVIDTLRAVDEHALVEVSGVIQEKHRRREQDPVEHELNAQRLIRIGFDAMRQDGEAGGRADAQAIFRSIAPAVRHASTAQAVRHVLGARGIVELPTPDLLSFIDGQALAALAHEDRVPGRDGRRCPHPPFHAYSRRLASGGLYRFACFSEATHGRPLLHVVLCQPEAVELQATLEELVLAISGSVAGLSSIEDAASEIGHASLARDARIRAGLGLVERRYVLRDGMTIGHSCVVLQNFGAASEAASTLGDAPHAFKAWRGLFEAGVAQPIPRMEMLTLWLHERAELPGRISSRVNGVDLSVDLADDKRSGAARAAQVAQLAEAEQLRVEIEILRGHASEVGEIAWPMPLEPALRTIEAVLPGYHLPLDLVCRLLDLCRRIHPDWRVERPVDLFQMLWTLLGSASVKSLLHCSAATTATVERLIEHRIVSDKRQLLYLYPAVLPALDALLDRCTNGELAALTMQLRTLMAQHPTLFSTATQTLAASRASNDSAAGRIANTLLRCAEIGISTPLLSRLASNFVGEAGQYGALLEALRRTGELVFRNDALRLPSVAASLLDACWGRLATMAREAGLSATPELGREILYYLYRPITMDFAMFCETLKQLSDRTCDWASWDVTGHGEFWNATLGCYEYWLDRGMGQIGKMRLYASKNVGSFFAKSTAGICTDINVELFNRRDHYHLNIVDADDGRAVGNVQLYAVEHAAERFLLVRGINPMQGWCAGGGADALVRCILHAISDMAMFGGFTQVRLSEQNGLWNSDSSRADVRACLKRMFADRPPRPMERPFHMYDYYGRALTVNAYYSVWEAKPDGPVRSISKAG